MFDLATNTDPWFGRGLEFTQTRPADNAGGGETHPLKYDLYDKVS